MPAIKRPLVVPPFAPSEQIRRWSLALGIAALLLFFFSPSWGAFALWARVPEMEGMLEVRRGASVLWQREHLGAALPDPLHAAIQWRLLFPVLGRVLPLPAPWFFALADAGCLLTLAYLITLLRRAAAGWTACAAITLALGAASWFFTSTGWLGYFDAWFALALLIVAFARDVRWVWAACVWAPWIDERFVVAAPLALLCRLSFHRVDGAAPPFAWRRDLLVPAGLLALFAIVRLGILGHYSSAGATVSGYLSARDYLAAPAGRITLGIWEGLRAGWLFAAGAVLLLWRAAPVFVAGQRVLAPRQLALLLAFAVVAIVVLGLATAQDYSRSMTMVFPAAVLGALLLVREGGPRWRSALPVGAALALLLPAHHVMSDRVNPIYYLYHELAALRVPPRAAMPELYELRAIHEMERGENAQAEADLTLAIKLAANPASPAKQRGILAASQGRWGDALRDFALLVEHDPANPDAWFMRAQAQLATGHSAEARSDFDRALALAPKGWSARPDVARFFAKLNRAP